MVSVFTQIQTRDVIETCRQAAFSWLGRGQELEGEFNQAADDSVNGAIVMKS